MDSVIGCWYIKEQKYMQWTKISPDHQRLQKFWIVSWKALSMKTRKEFWSCRVRLVFLSSCATLRRQISLLNEHHNLQNTKKKTSRHYISHSFTSVTFTIQIPEMPLFYLLDIFGWNYGKKHIQKVLMFPCVKASVRFFWTIRYSKNSLMQNFHRKI